MAILIILMLCFWPLETAFSSELLGRISTNPADPRGALTTPGQPEPGQPPAGQTQTAGGGAILGSNGFRSARSAPAPEAGAEEADRTVVLGITHYPDKSLVRGPDRRVYLISGRTKSHIRAWADLNRYYRGQEILEIEPGVLAGYQDLPYAEGDLIRAAGQPEVYAVLGGQRCHVISWEDLWRHYRGQVIHNVSLNALASYPEKRP